MQIVVVIAAVIQTRTINLDPAKRKVKNPKEAASKVILRRPLSWCAMHGGKLEGGSPLWGGNRQPLAKSKGVHCEVESEGRYIYAQFGELKKNVCV
jgi:hypothetical protein